MKNSLKTYNKLLKLKILLNWLHCTRLLCSAKFFPSIIKILTNFLKISITSFKHPHKYLLGKVWVHRLLSTLYWRLLYWLLLKFYRKKLFYLLLSTKNLLIMFQEFSSRCSTEGRQVLIILCQFMGEWCYLTG